MIAPADKASFLVRAFQRHRPILAHWGSGWVMEVETSAPEIGRQHVRVSLEGWYMIPRVTDDVHAIVAAHQRWREKAAYGRQGGVL